MPAAKKLEINFPDIDKETKGTRRFTEEPRAKDARPFLGKMYLTIEGWEKIGSPDAIKVTIEPA